jgi:hypothetical protein
MVETDEEILEALEFSPIGGGTAYTEAAGKLDPADADIEVSSVEGLQDALEGPEDIIAIENDAELDLTGIEMLDLQSKTLVSYRGWDDQEGALLYTDSAGYFGDRPYTLFYSFGSPRVTGLRIRGARYDEEFTQWDYDENLARAIMLRGPGGEVDNCEFWGWTWNAVHLKGEGEDTVTEAEVHHNHIHQAYQIGYGYGIDIWRGFGDIHHNYFNETRHAIDGFGWWNSGYVVENNIFGPSHYSHTVDMHSLEENDAQGRVGDDQDDPDYDLRAGGTMEIYRNTFTMDEATHGGGINAIAVRGVPWDGVWIENNEFAHPERPPYNSGNTQEGFAWRQVNLELSGWDPIELDDEGYTLNWNDSDNLFGWPDIDWVPETGAPIDLATFEESVFTIDGEGRTTHYEFMVTGEVEKSAEYDGTINPFDEIDGQLVTGRTTNEPDSFAYTGEIVGLVPIRGGDFYPEVLIDGEEVDIEDLLVNVVTITGLEEPASYEFTVTDSVERSVAYGGTYDPEDEIDELTVTGEATDNPDSFAFIGSILTFDIDAPAEVLINGEEVDPDELGGDVITITGQGTTAQYDFTVTGNAEKTNAYGATINPFDEIDGSMVTGRTTQEPDSYLFTGDINDFDVDEDVEVLINGEEVSIEDL